MINSIFDSTSIPLLEQVATFTERRQDVLAGNIANINTDDYRMRDLDVKKFQATLKEAVERLRDSPKSKSAYAQFPYASPGFTQPELVEAGTQNITDLFTPDLFEAMQDTPENLTFYDGNNRSIEAEVMEMTKNAMLQSYAIEIINSQMALLEHVITERV